MSRARHLYTVPFIVPFMILGGTRPAAADPGNANACPFRATRAVMSAIEDWTPPSTSTGIGRVRIDDVPSLNDDDSVDPSNPIETTIVNYSYNNETTGTWWFREFGHPDGHLIGPKVQAATIRSQGATDLRKSRGTIADLAALAKYRSSSEITWSKDLSVFEVFSDPKSKTSKPMTAARIVQLVKDMPEAVGSKRILLAHDTSDVSQLESSTTALFSEVESLDEDSFLIHSDDGKQFLILRRIGGHAVALSTKSAKFASSLIDAMPSGLAVVVSGKVTPSFKTSRFVIWRSMTATLPIGEAIAHAKSNRVFKPGSIVNGVPKDKDELAAQGLDATALAAYQGVAKSVDDWAAGLKAPAISSKADFIKLLTEGKDDFVVVVAHSDGKSIFIGGKEVTLAELDALPDRKAPNRTVVLAVCNSGQLTASLSNLEGLGQLIIKKGFAKSVVAPAATINQDQVNALTKAVGTNLEGLIKALEGIPGNWRLLAETFRASVAGES